MLLLALRKILQKLHETSILCSGYFQILADEVEIFLFHFKMFVVIIHVFKLYIVKNLYRCNFLQMVIYGDKRFHIEGYEEGTEAKL